MPRQLRISRFWRGQFVRRSSLAGTGPARHLRHLKARVSGLTRGLSGWDCVNFPVKSHSNNNSPHLPQLPNTKRRVSDDPWFQRFARAIEYNPKAMLRYFTSGESHGEALVAFLSGLPAGVEVDQAFLDRELWRRQQGYGRGGRMKIESDKAHILSGVRHGKTIGSPIAVLLENKDWKNWQESLPVEEGEAAKHKRVASPRPGHADLAGALKYNFPEARYVLERASARESAARVAVGGLAKLFLRELRIEVLSHVVAVGSATVNKDVSWDEIHALSQRQEILLNCADSETEPHMKEEVDKVLKSGDSVGGVFEVVAHNVPPGLGTYAQWDERLDAL